MCVPVSDQCKGSEGKTGSKEVKAVKETSEPKRQHGTFATLQWCSTRFSMDISCIYRSLRKPKKVLKSKTLGCGKLAE